MRDVREHTGQDITQDAHLVRAQGSYLFSLNACGFRGSSSPRCCRLLKRSAASMAHGLIWRREPVFSSLVSTWMETEIESQYQHDIQVYRYWAGSPAATPRTPQTPVGSPPVGP